MRWKLIAIVVLAGLLVPGLQSPAAAGGWTLSSGQTWLKIGFMVQVTDDRYFFDGRRIPYFFDGHNRTLGAFLDARHGITDRLEVGMQMPAFSVQFNDLAGDRSTTGIGDLRLGLRYNVLLAPMVATVGATVKFPTGEFVNDAEIVPVGEGQYDYELTLELARSFWPRPGYFTGMIGYRLRTENQETGIDHGNELIWSVEIGYSVLPRLIFKALARGLEGSESFTFGLPIASLERRITYVEPGLIFEMSPGRNLELSVPISLSGKNWPAGPVLNVGFSQTF